MASANSQIQLADLDFADIKSNFITFLQSNPTFKDYNFTGSALSTLLDVLAYNTQYNAYYLNMVANEMFLDTALQRNSVVSHAKMLGYTPKSAIAPTATIGLVAYGVNGGSLTLPRYTKFMSQSVNGVNYSFITVDDHTVNVVANTATYDTVQIKQGTVVDYSFTADLVANPQSIFEIPDPNIDTTSLQVIVQVSNSNTNSTVFTLAKDYTLLSNTDTVYYLQEGKNGNYQIYFGDNVLSKGLDNGNIVNVTYISTGGSASAGANSFVMLDTVGGAFSNVSIYPITPANQGGDKESIDSIKFLAPKSYAAQGRAVTKDDYITLLQQNNRGYNFDAVNVWGGEENNPPSYGQIFVAIKPTGGYSLTSTQKQDIINNIINPASVLTVTPVLIDVDYTYLMFNISVVYDPKKTRLTASQIESLIKSGVTTYCNKTLNTFNSVFTVGGMITYLQSLNNAITGLDFDLFLQKRITPTLNSSSTYTINMGNEIENGTGEEALSITPSFSQYDFAGNYYPEVYFEQTPIQATYITDILLQNGGQGYTNPTVSISGDGSGATATAIVYNGVITGFKITNSGSGYSQAIVTISDPTGVGAYASAVINTDVGQLRTYFYNNSVKNILTGQTSSATSTTSTSVSAGTVKYSQGIITLDAFTPSAINSDDGVLRITGYSAQRIVSSTFNNIITLDNNDGEAIKVNVIAQ